MNIDVFETIARKQYELVCGECRQHGNRYPLPFEEILEVFKSFFSAYRDRFHEDHPNMKAEQVREIIRKIPWIDDYMKCLCDVADIDADTYAVLIERYFRTPFRNCDYRINHFFSGQIRALRFYETLY